MSRLRCFACALWLFTIALLAGQQPERGVVMLVPMPAGPCWQDYAFLAALPAAKALHAHGPLVLAVAADGKLADEQLAFLRRVRPDRVLWLGGEPASLAVEGIAGQFVPANSPNEMGLALLQHLPPGNSAVVVPPDDYEAALVGAVLAARLQLPLFWTESKGLPAAVLTALELRKCRSLLLVGDFRNLPTAAAGLDLQRLPRAADAARWLVRQKQPVEYLAATAPADRLLAHGGKLSLAAAALAIGRSGALVPLGSANLAPASAAVARSQLRDFHSVLDAVPALLCLAGVPAAVPMAVVPSGEGIDSDPPSDLAYADIDADPFLETGFARLVAEEVCSGTLLAARNLAYPALLSPEFTGKFAVAEWERMCAPLFTNVGYQPPVVHHGGKPFGSDSPLCSVAAIVHGAHSSWLQLGETATWADRSLLAPCVVESSGCSAAALDQDAEQRSVALRMLRNGAVAFVGNVRKGVAQSEHYRSEFWNALLAGQPLGLAHRHALNCVMAAMIAEGQQQAGLRRYQFYNAACYGDPAFVLHRPAAPQVKSARTESKGREVVVHAPGGWWQAEQVIVPDWGYTRGARILSWRGAGVGVDSSWDGENRRNRDQLYYTAAVRTRLRTPRLVAVRPPAAPLGWQGQLAIDEHEDGWRTVYFRVRCIDFDMDQGVVLQQVDALRFRLE